MVKKNVIRIGGHESQSGYFDIPAWSLSALLKLIPKFSLEKDISNNAAFEMVCWLKENNKI